MNESTHTFVEAAKEASRVAWEFHVSSSTIPTFDAIGPRRKFETYAGLGYEVDSDDLLNGLQFSGGLWTGVHHYFKHGPCDKLAVVDCDLSQHHKWASRSYRMRASNGFVNTSIRNVLTEHGIYWNIAGYAGEQSFFDNWPTSLLVRRCLFENIGSQAIQLVQRAREQDFDFEVEGDVTPGGLLKVEQSIFRNIGFNHSGNARAAYALSFFRSLNDVSIDKILLDNTSQTLSKGALLVEARGSLELSNAVFLMGRTDRSIAKIVGVDNVAIRNCHFYSAGGQQWIDLVDCSNVVLQGCTGNVRVHRNKHDVGPITQDILV